MPTITVSTIDSVQIEYKEALEAYDVLEVKLDHVIDNLNYGPDLNDKGTKLLDDLFNLKMIVTAVGRFLPDEVETDIFSK